MSQQKTTRPTQLKSQAQAMAATGCSTAIIAERLHISERHARRLTEGPNTRVNETIGTAEEWRLWEGWYRVLLSFRKVAWRFGISHETVRKALETNSEETL